jgi:hypothetical protein
MSDLRENVERGAAWLDTESPGWELKIDVQELAMQSCGRCVLGQVFAELAMGEPGFNFVMDQRHAENMPTFFLNADTEGWDIQHGFNLRCYSDGWDELRAAWVDEIKRRLDQGIEL